MKRVLGLTFFGLLACAGSTFAQELPNDPQRRRIVAPSIRAATDCISREALSEFGLLEYVRNGHLGDTLEGPIRRCSGAVTFMTSEFDRAYYYGAGETFLKGPYRADLPRAVLARIGPEVNRRQSEQDRQQAETARRRNEEAQAAQVRRQEEDRLATVRRADEQAAAEQRLAERKLEMARIESNQRAEQLKQDEIKRQQLEAANRATDILKDRMFACATRETNDMVRSGESADVVATAAMTLCDREIDQALDSLIGVRKIETGSVVGTSESEAIKAAGRSMLKGRVLAMTVKAKAARAGSN